ncbi:unnamed protein product [Cylicocyclus nassatus]|uniref:Glucosidase 2 subunit beta n=1 Tax=Cylicocyclus nassatus TaxID=53992 RepID=A0AA36H7X9_CYLNA|nr:unnamed protein product [Cylicocyclus nassatus]
MLLCGICAALVVAAFATDRSPDIETIPLGVPYNRAGLYKRAAEFVCFDGSKSIPYNQVNDDYCDCPDGSDEPGTSACPNGRFHCPNKGHIAMDIPSSRVDDSICDCCDGSDEYAGAVKCPNICDELGRSAREEKKRQAEIARKGYATRKLLAVEGKKLRDEKVAQCVPLKEEREKLLPTRDELLKKKDEAMEIESKLKDKHREEWDAQKREKKKEKATAMFSEIDVNKDGKITLDELVKVTYLDTDHDGTVSEDEAKIFLSVDEVDAENFLNNMYDRLKTEKVAYEDYKRDLEREEAEKKEREEAEKKEQEEAEKAEFEEAEKATHEELEETGDHPHPLDDEDKADTVPHPVPITTQPPPPPLHDDDEFSMPPYDEETKKAINEADEARKAYDEYDVKIINLDKDIREAESFIEQDFGPDHAWATLKGKCFDLTDKQYTYTYCPFDRTIQKDKNGYGETGLGNWKDWTGDASNKYTKQRYENGQQCWNGPQRSTDVEIQCGEESELIEATEPAKCEYRFVFRTPAACNDPDQEEPIHAEL